MKPMVYEISVNSPGESEVGLLVPSSKEMPDYLSYLNIPATATALRRM
jgi:hypothetical protein